MALQRYTKAYIDKELAKQAKQFQEYLIECLRLTFQAHGVCLHLIKKNGEECAICEKYVPKD